MCAIIAVKFGMASSDGAHPPTSAPGRPLRIFALNRPVLVVLLVIPLLLDAALLAAYALMVAADGTAIEGIARDVLRGFEFSNESNVPTWVASLYWAAFGVAGLLLALMARTHRGFFALLGAVGLFASLDEAAELHERLETVGAAILPDDTSFEVGWVIPGGVLALAVGLLFLRSVLRLPRRARLGIIVGGAVFLSGAIGVEVAWAMLLGADVDQFSLVSMLFNIVEENLELMGIGVAIAGLSSLVKASRSDEKVRLEIDRLLLVS